MMPDSDLSMLFSVVSAADRVIAVLGSTRRRRRWAKQGWLFWSLVALMDVLLTKCVSRLIGRYQHEADPSIDNSSATGQLGDSFTDKLAPTYPPGVMPTPVWFRWWCCRLADPVALGWRGRSGWRVAGSSAAVCRRLLRCIFSPDSSAGLGGRMLLASPITYECCLACGVARWFIYVNQEASPARVFV